MKGARVGWAGLGGQEWSRGWVGTRLCWGAAGEKEELQEVVCSKISSFHPLHPTCL